MKVCVRGAKKFDYPTELLHAVFEFLQSEVPLSKDIVISFTETRVGNMTTGLRSPNEIRVIAKNRMLIDVIRTLMHEWVHEFQHQKLGLKDNENIPDIGGPAENMANVLAGIFMKKFQKRYPIFEKDLYNEF